MSQKTVKVSIKALAGNFQKREVAAYSDPEAELVVTGAVSGNGYCITHRRTGGAILWRQSLIDCLRVLPRLLTLTDWSEAFILLEPKDKELSAKIAEATGQENWPNDFYN